MSTQSALVAPGTRYATLGTPMGIIRGLGGVARSSCLLAGCSTWRAAPA